MAEEIQVVTGALVREGRIFLQQRNALDDYPLHWETPGGKVELGEEPVAAMEREWYEETGRLAEVDALLGFKTFNHLGRSEHFRVSLYRMISSETGYGAYRELINIHGCGWFTPDEAQQLVSVPSLHWILNYHCGMLGLLP